MGITCKNEGVFGLLNIKSFLVFHIVQITAHTPTLIRMSSFLGMPLSQFPKKIVIFFGRANPNVIKIIRQTILANGHSKASFKEKQSTTSGKTRWIEHGGHKSN
jgi:hypothetical protein